MFNNPRSKIFIPDQSPEIEGIKRTTHLAIGAHQDDIEIMAINGILHCFDNPCDFFSGVVVTDGRSSPRSGVYTRFSDDEMMKIREHEQNKAAVVGNYSSAISLGYSSKQVKDKTNQEPTDDLLTIIELAKPRIVYTHNLADKHPTHVAVAIRVIEAIRQCKNNLRPEKLYGCEVWRDLDWMPDSQKIAFNCSTQINLQQSLLGVFDSQISGGKRYDLATMGRRLANATYFESHGIDATTYLSYAMDLTPLIQNDSLDVIKFINNQIYQFQKEILDLLGMYL